MATSSTTSIRTYPSPRYGKQSTVNHLPRHLSKPILKFRFISSAVPAEVDSCMVSCAGVLSSSPGLHPLNDVVTLQVTFNLNISRKAAYYGLNILAPCIMIVALALLMFWLPADSGEKVSLGITILLAFSVFQLVLADRSPTTSDFFPVLCEYILSRVQSERKRTRKRNVLPAATKLWPRLCFYSCLSFC